MRMFYINQLLQRYDSLRTNYKEKLEEIEEFQIELLAIIKNIENRENPKDKSQGVVQQFHLIPLNIFLKEYFQNLKNLQFYL